MLGEVTAAIAEVGEAMYCMGGVLMICLYTRSRLHRDSAEVVILPAETKRDVKQYTSDERLILYATRRRRRITVHGNHELSSLTS